MYYDTKLEYILNKEAETRRLEASKRQVPFEFRKGTFDDARSWLASQVLWPAVDASARAANVAGYHGGRYWRRAYTRALGLLFNGFENVKEAIANRPSMA